MGARAEAVEIRGRTMGRNSARRKLRRHYWTLVVGRAVMAPDAQHSCALHMILPVELQVDCKAEINVVVAAKQRERVNQPHCLRHRRHLDCRRASAQLITFALFAIKATLLVSFCKLSRVKVNSNLLLSLSLPSRVSQMKVGSRRGSARHKQIRLRVVKS